VPTPDLVAPQPEWVRGHPDDLNDADFWPAMDIPLMEDSDEVPVRFCNGELQLRMKDVGSDGYGIPWGHTRIYSNRLSNSFDFGNGTNWLVLEWPQLVRRRSDPREVKRLHPSGSDTPTGCTLMVLRGTRNALWFDEFQPEGGGTPYWHGRFGSKSTLTQEVNSRKFRLTAPNGHRWEFYPFTPNCFERPAQPDLTPHDWRLNGKFHRHLGPGEEGDQDIVATYKDGKLQYVSRTGEGVEERFGYDYYQEGENKGRLRYVTWRRGGKDLRRSEYLYYGSDERYGNLGDLKLARTLVPSPDGWAHRTNAWNYFRYLKEPVDTYCQGLLSCMVGPEAFHRMHLDQLNPLTAGDEEIARYADLKVAYYDGKQPWLARRVKSIDLSGGVRRHAFEYELLTPPPDAFKDRVGYNVQVSKTVELRPDQTKKQVMCNFVGRPLRLDLIDGDARWTHEWVFDEKHGALVEKREPSAVRYREAPLSGLPGKSYVLTHLETGSDQAYLYEVFIRQFPTDNLFKQKRFSYVQVAPKVPMWAIESEITFGIASDGSHAMTAMQYRWRGLARMTWRRVDLPLVKSTHFKDADELDPKNTQDAIEQEYDLYGNLVRSVDERRTETAVKLDVARGSPISQTVTYDKGDGERVSARYDFESDDVGRIVKVVGPPFSALVPGNDSLQVVRSASWHLYKELDGEVWTTHGHVEPGTQADDGARAQSPVEIDRYDRANRLVDSIAAIWTRTRIPKADDTFSQSSWVRWTHQSRVRTVVDGHPRQETVARLYHLIPATSGEVGRPGTNYSETRVSADLQSRVREVVTTGGSYFQTTFEARGLPTVVRSGVSREAPVVLGQFDYDGGRSGGNGVLTQLKRSDGTRDRVSKWSHDFRDRTVLAVEADEGMVQFEHTNQGAVTKQTRSMGTKKLAEKAFLVDVRGRTYATQLVGFSRGPKQEPLQPLIQWTLYDSANQVIAIEPPGAVELPITRSRFQPRVVFRYDGLGQEITNQTAVADVHGLLTYAQVDTRRNLLGMPVAITTRGRFPDEAVGGASPRGPLGDELGRGPLGTPGFTPARTRRLENVFDGIGRMRVEFDRGGLGATAALGQWSEYDQAGDLCLTIDALGRNQLFGWDHAGRPVRGGANLSKSVFQAAKFQPLKFLPDDSQYWEATYNSEHRITSHSFFNPHTGRQLEQILYGPPLIPGRFAPREATLPRELIDADGRRLRLEYNLLGEVFRTTDDNGTVHEFERDVMGRVIADRLVAFDPIKVDFTVQRIEYAYDDFGRILQITSFDAPSLGKRLNMVIRKYGTFNEMIVEANAGNDFTQLV
jgi:hypothetical protein